MAGLTPYGVIDQYFYQGGDRGEPVLGWGSLHAQKIMDLLDAEGWKFVKKDEPRAVTSEDHYLVTWEYDVFDADSPHAAAQEALDTQRDPTSIATVFTVTDQKTGTVRQVDLLEDSWTPINDHPGDQQYDDIPGTRDESYWGTIGDERDGGPITVWSWTILARNNQGEQWEQDGGYVGSEAEAKRAVETWRPE